LRGSAPSDFTWLLLAIIAGATFLAVTAISQWQFRRA
jgi:hypothetical protein